MVVPITPLSVMSETTRPVIAWLKVGVNCVVAVATLPLAVTLSNVTAVVGVGAAK